MSHGNRSIGDLLLIIFKNGHNCKNTKLTFIYMCAGFPHILNIYAMPRIFLSENTLRNT